MCTSVWPNTQKYNHKGTPLGYPTLLRTKLGPQDTPNCSASKAINLGLSPQRSYSLKQTGVNILLGRGMGPIDRGRLGGSLKSCGKSHRDLEEEGSLEERQAQGGPRERHFSGFSWAQYTAILSYLLLCPHLGVIPLGSPALQHREWVTPPRLALV